MIEFSSRDQVEEWHYSCQHIQAAILATRASLRALPQVAIIIDEIEGNTKVDQFVFCNSVILPVFRMLSTAWVHCKYPKSAKENWLIEKLDFDTFSNIPDIQDSVVVAYTVDAAVNAVTACKKSSDAAKVDAASIDFSAEAIAAFISDDDIYQGIRAGVLFESSVDATALEAHVKVSTLADRPLWSKNLSVATEKNWTNLKSYLLIQDKNWQVWTDWYEARLNGREVWRKSLEIARLNLDDSFWKSGSEIVNRNIHKLIVKRKAKRAEYRSLYKRRDIECSATYAYSATIESPIRLA